MAVSASINPSIDNPADTEKLVAGHQKYWAVLPTKRTALNLVEYSTRKGVVTALNDPNNPDKVLYFYCHATSIDTDPDRSAIIMVAPTNWDEFITLGDLNLDAPMTVKLAWQPLVILNARLRIGPTSRHASVTDSSRTSRPRAVGV
jgi:hypothetical protein